MRRTEQRDAAYATPTARQNQMSCDFQTRATDVVMSVWPAE
jgi:hypothetical protein